MGLVRLVVDANWNTGCSAQRVSVDWVHVGNCSGCRVRPSFSACSLSALRTVVSEEDDAHLLESRLQSSSRQPYRLMNGVSHFALLPIEAGHRQ